MIEISPSSVMQTRAFLFSEKGRKHMFDKIKADIKSVRERDPAVKSDLEVFFLYPSFIGDYCTLYQNVTLGGTGKDTGKRHPTLGNNVMVGSGARVLGPFKVGDNAKIAANAVVLSEVPPNSTAVGVPARIVRRDGQRVNACDLDQIHIPDPVAQQICALQSRLETMQSEIDLLREELKENNIK